MSQLDQPSRGGRASASREKAGAKRDKETAAAMAAAPAAQLASGVAGKSAISIERQFYWWAIALFLGAGVFYILSPVLAPFVAGTALGFLLDPVADRLQRLGASRLGAALLIVTLFVLVVVAALLILLPILSHQFAAFITALPGYIQTLHGLVIDWSESLTSDYFAAWLEKYGVGRGASAEVQKYINDLAGQSTAYVGEFLKSLLWRGYVLINVISLVVITPVVAFYMLLDWDHMLAIIDEHVPPRYRGDVRGLASDINRALAGFVRGQSLVCLFLGLWYAVGLSAIGLNFGFLIGVIAGCLSFIPYVGSITAFGLSIVVAIVQAWPYVNLPVEAIAIVSAGLFLDGYVLSPRLVGASVGLHPVWIMFALLAFGTLFGFTGLIVAVPVAAALGALIRFLARRYRASALYREPSYTHDRA